MITILFLLLYLGFIVSVRFLHEIVSIRFWRRSGLSELYSLGRYCRPSRMLSYRKCTTRMVPLETELSNGRLLYNIH